VQIKRFVVQMDWVWTATRVLRANRPTCTANLHDDAGRNTGLHLTAHASVDLFALFRQRPRRPGGFRCRRRGPAPRLGGTL